MSRPVRWLACALLASCLAGTVLYAVAVLAGTGVTWLDGFAESWGTTAVQGVAVALVALRVTSVPEERLAWGALVVALGAYVAGDVTWAALGFPPVSAADVLYGVSYAGLYLNLGLLVRSRGLRFRASAWLDGIIGTLCAVAVSATLVLPVVARSGGSALEVTVNLAYPLADLVLVAVAITGIALTGWRPSPAWLALALGNLADGVVDSLYAFGVASTPVASEAVLFTLWLVSWLLMAVSPWLPSRARSRDGRPDVRLLLVPSGFALVATALLLRESVGGGRTAGLVFAALTIVAVLVRMSLFFREITRLQTGLARAEALAATDPLTGLLNHRAFHERLGALVDDAVREGTPLCLVVADIDHFKLVNDSRGHQAGDALLAAVAERLVAVARDGDVVGRVGGEEFAWVLPGCDELEAVEAADRMRVAVAGACAVIDGLGSMTVSAGVASVARAGGPAELFRLADGALYWAKAHGRNRVVVYSPEVVTALSAGEEAQQLARTQALNAVNVLARAVDAKDPYTQRHSERVADLATGIATALGWPLSGVVALREAALVHDVGKIGVPEEVLTKPGSLTPAEWDRVRAHPALGAQIISGVLTADQVAWVRGHHERHDGGGYPDGLAGDAVPDGAAVLAVADAWDAMTSDRPYRSALPPDEALRRCVAERGTQFRPEVVDALRRMYAAGAVPSPPAREEAAAPVAADPVG